jgi:cell division protein FtsI/penicillin-binding protein 2
MDNRPVFDDAGNPVFDPDRPVKNRDGTPKLDADGEPMLRQALEKGTHSWFIGYAPADKPKFVVVALKEFGGFGATYAAPLVREAFLQLERHDYLPRLDVP